MDAQHHGTGQYTNKNAKPNLQQKAITHAVRVNAPTTSEALDSTAAAGNRTDRQAQQTNPAKHCCYVTAPQQLCWVEANKA
jgi:hypothetical protein